MTRTLSVTNVKAHLPGLLAGVQERSEEIVITKNGSPAAILINYDEYESIKETLEILSNPRTMKQIARSRKYFANGGKGIPFEKVFK